MNIFKDGGSYTLKTAKYERLKDCADGIKDTVIYESKGKKNVSFFVGRKYVIKNNYFEVEYRLTRELTDEYKDCTDDEIAKIIAENPKDATKGFFAYIASTIIMMGQTMCDLPALYTSTEYTVE